MQKYKITVDIIIRYKGGIILIKRKNPPIGWAFPSGKLNEGESLEHAAKRESEEETGLNITILRQFHTYSGSKRFEGCKTITTVFIAEGNGELKAGDDAGEAKVFDIDKVPNLEMDHNEILLDYQNGEY